MCRGVVMRAPPPSQVELAKLKEDSPQLMTKAEELLKAINWVC